MEILLTLLQLTFFVLFMGVQQPIVQRDIFINHRAKMFASVDVVSSNGDTQRLRVSELLVLLDGRLTQRDWG